MGLPNQNITQIPTNPKPAAIPSLWNVRYTEIDQNFAYLESSKQNALGYIPLNKAGDAMAGALRILSGIIAPNNPNNCGQVFTGDNDTGLANPADGVLQLVVNGLVAGEFNSSHERKINFGPANAWRLAMQADGNVVVYDAVGTAVFTTNAAASQSYVQSVLAALGIGTTDCIDYTGDLNGLLTGGLWLASGPNTPDGNPVHVIVMTNAGSYCSQIAVPQTGSDLYYRTSAAGAWTGWNKVAKSNSPIFTGIASFEKLANATLFANGGATEGGELRLEKPASGTSLSADVAIDLVGDTVRIFEAGGALRGVYVNLSGAGAQSRLWHEGNDGSGSGLDADLLDGQQGAYYAPLASPALTGSPTAPTATAGANDARLANTAFVQAAIAAVVEAAPGTLDTLNELAAALGDDPNFATTMANALAGKAPLNSPALTGFPTVNRTSGEGQLGLGQNDGYFYANGGAAGWYSPTLGSFHYDYVTNKFLINGYQAWSAGNHGPGSGLNADMLDGYHISTPGDRWGVIPVVSGDGGLEIGWYIDFHGIDADNGDYAARLEYTEGRIRLSGIALTLETDLINGLAGKQNALGYTPLNKGGDTATGKVFFEAAATGDNGIGTATSNLGEIEVKGNGVGAAVATFHRPGAYAAYFGLDIDNQWKVGGWSMGAAAHTLWHSGNLNPAGSAKAWVNFDGTLSGSITPRANLNVASVTKTATGAYTLNFTAALPDANYALLLSLKDPVTTSDGGGTANIVSQSATSASITAGEGASNGLTDNAIICAAIFGN